LRFASIAMASFREDFHLQGEHHAGRTRARPVYHRRSSLSSLLLLSSHHSSEPVPERASLML
jgi:hypothetical protein